MSIFQVDRLVSRRHRSSSLSLVNNQSLLLNLPAELIYAILNFALLQTKAAVLASVSKTINDFINYIIYHTVILDSEQSTTLFIRTVQSKPDSFLANYVRKFVLTWNPIPYSSQAHDIWNILDGCTGLKALVLPEGFHPISLAHLVCNVHKDSVQELTISSYTEMDELGRITTLFTSSHDILHSASLFSSLTHLRICEPSHGWFSPSQILDTFGGVPNLTNLQLNRRINSNEENDIIFAEEIVETLKTRKELKLLVVGLFAQTWDTGACIKDSGIWNLMHGVAMRDSRLVLMEGVYDEWKNEWKGARNSALVDFWATAEEQREQL
jgi:hypothetical protein